MWLPIKTFQHNICVWSQEKWSMKWHVFYSTWVNVKRRDGGRGVIMATWFWCASGDINFSQYNARPLPANVDGLHQKWDSFYPKHAWYKPKFSKWTVGTRQMRTANDTSWSLMLCLRFPVNDVYQQYKKIGMKAVPPLKNYLPRI